MLGIIAWGRRPGMNRRVVVLLLAVSTLALACSGLSSQATPAPEPTVEVSHEAAERFEEKIGRVIGGEGGRFRLEITEEELTSYLAENLKDSPLLKPQVRFTEGRIHVSGAITPLGIRLSATCTAQLANGQVEVTIEKATIASFPIPGLLLNYTSQVIEESIEDMRIDITELKVLPGRVVIGGTR